MVSSLNWILLTLLTGAAPATPSTEPSIRPGWDWTLPPHIKPVSYSGFVTWGSERFDPMITVRGVSVTWKRLNPRPGVYDWPWLEEQLEKNAEAGLRTGIHLKGVQREAVPDWVVEKYRPVVVDVPPLQDNQPWRIQNVLPWQPDVDRAFCEFLRAFGERGIARREDVVYGYIHGISASRGEEMFIRPIDLQMWQATTGLTADQFAAWLRGRIDAMCDAFRGVEYKLALMFGGPLGPNNEFRAATAGLVDYAIQRGTGIRGGGIDFMHGLFDEPGWASRVDAAGYCLVNDEHPIIKQRRFRGDENEEYGKYWEWRFGPAEQYPYRHRISVLRGLQMRQNFQYVSGATLELNPDLNRYALLTQGFRHDDSPDAWAYLRECALHRYIVRNMERWLLQRDQPGSMTVPAERIDRYPLASDSRDRHYDMDARRTDVANGQHGILFRLDPVFWDRPGPATIKVTYTDRAPTRWWIHYTNASGEPINTLSVQNTGDGHRKTVTFQVESLARLGRLPDDPGFQQWVSSLPADPASIVENQELAGDWRPWHPNPLYRVVADPARAGRRVIEFRYQRQDDTVHMDQLLDVRKGVTYRVSGQVRNDGTGLRPAVRIAGMDWSTLLYLESTAQGEWETLAGTFTAKQDGTVRLQLFGQGRGNQAPGLAGKSAFRDVDVRPAARDELLAGRAMDFRVETDGAGDLTVTLVRVIKGYY